MTARRGNYGPSLSKTFCCDYCVYVSSTTRWIDTGHNGKIARTRYSCPNYGQVKRSSICMFFDNDKGGTYQQYMDALKSGAFKKQEGAE